MASYDKIYHFEKINQNGKFLKVQKGKEVAFQVNELQSLQRKMIESNKIPRLLNMHFEEMNDQLSIYYFIDGKKSLKNYLREHPFSMSDYYSFFIYFIQALEDTNNHMLDQSSFVIDENYIYLGEHPHSIHLVYLPVKHAQAQDVDEKLKQLLLHVASEVNGLEGKQFKLILNYIKSSSFNLQGIKKLLISLQNEHGGEVEKEENEVVENETVKRKTKVSFTALTSKNKLYTALFGVLFLVVVWNLLATKPIIAGVITWFALLVVLIFVIKGIPKFKMEKEVVQVKNPKGKKKLPETPKVEEKPQIVEKVEEQPVVEPVEEPVFDLHAASVDSTNPEMDESAYDEEDFFTDDQTILLDESKEPVQEELPCKNILLLQSEDGEKEFELTDDTVVVGRADKGTTIKSEGLGVSRFHIELIKLSDMYGIKDLGSKNGTLVNDEKLIPYKIYELKDQDEIVIGKEKYQYKVEA